jgi:hypothetical protein
MFDMMKMMGKMKEVQARMKEAQEIWERSGCMENREQGS